MCFVGESQGEARDVSKTETGSDEECPPKRQALSAATKDHPLLLVLPPGRAQPGRVVPTAREPPRVKDRGCLVDTLIADLVGVAKESSCVLCTQTFKAKPHRIMMFPYQRIMLT